MTLKTFKQFISESEMLSESMINPIFSGDKELRKLEFKLQQGFKSAEEKGSMQDELFKAYKKYEPAFKKAQSKFESIINGALPKGDKQTTTFLRGLKPFKSIVDKAIERKKGFMGLNDLVRGAVLLADRKQAEDFVANIMRKYKSMVVGYEDKARGKDKTYGYFGSHHIDMNIDGIIVELQIMTKKLWTYKHAAHEIYTANRSKAGGPNKQDQYDSKRFFSMGNRDNIREEFEEFDECFTEAEIAEFGEFAEEMTEAQI